MPPARLILLLLVLAVPLAVLATLPSCSGKDVGHPRVIVIGFDGLDPRLCERMMAAGELPNLQKMRDGGGYSPLGTTIPPQSPVAWATFITGADPGTHGIFDFIHRDPKHQCEPYYSAARTLESDDGWEVDQWRIPLTFWPFNHNPTQTQLRREGTPFWEYLDAAAIPVWMYDIPANYPPSPSKYGNLKCLAGMGVPDLLGTYGTYQYFARGVRRVEQEGGGMRKPLRFEEGVARGTLTGPVNSLLKEPVDTEVEFTVLRHPTEREARIDVQDHTLVLKEGEWSDWLRIDFTLDLPPFLPDESVSGICRFYLQQVRPDFCLYVSPINIDPSDPGEQRVTEPPGFLTEISDKLGLFYTTGFQEDHKALSNRVFNDEEYFQQANDVLEERFRLLDYALDRYEDGLLFFYFSSTDLQAHMFWWDSDEPHPVRTPEQAQRYHASIEALYRRADAVVGDITKRFGDTATILVISDHGFSNFRRQFNLNTWLRDNGYLQPPTCESILVSTGPVAIDWSQTRAYALGLNGLYLNLQGRERDGIVSSAERHALLQELRDKLLTIRDPENGRPVIAEIYFRDEVYHGPYAAGAPDLLIGYHRDYRASWATTLGSMETELIRDNDSAWSADHCIATDQVPGVVFSNKPVKRPSPELMDIAPTILEEFGVNPPPSIRGHSIFRYAAGDLAAARKE